ncbi:MAG TPA: glycoside hydrolase family 88 protein [Terracidiphilus sp.]|nr:glycoside hydrolase family 88 protein [Terracidiphilus sp.]
MTGDPSIRNLMARVADATLYYPCYRYKVWGYGEWIALEGLLAAARLCEHSRYMGFVEGLIAGWISKRTELIPADHVAPGVALVELYKLTGREMYLDRALALAKLLLDSPRSSRGARLLRPDANRHIYVDCLYSDPPLFCRLGLITGEKEWFDVAASYAQEFWDVLVDGRMPLLYHGYSEDSSGPIGLLWGRGAGWALLGLVDTLADMPESAKGRDTLLANLKAMAGALRELQAADGAWHTVLDHPETYLENSIACFACAGFLKGMRTGLLDSSFEESANRSWHALSGAILPNGQLLVSEATPEGDLKAYQSLGLGVFPWGQGAVLRAIEERIRTETSIRLD